MNKVPVMLIDDHAILRAGLRMLINSQSDMEVVGEAGDASEALAQAKRTRPEVVVLDLSLPGGPSLPLIQELRKLEGAPRTLILTMHNDPAYVRSALAAGAAGYLVKTISEQEVLQAIRDVYRGRLIIDLDDEQATAAVFHSLPVPATPEKAHLRLSHREEEVLKLLGQGLSNQTISELLDLSPKTIATYRARIAEKLGLKSTAEFVKYAVNVGLVRPTEG